MSAELPPITVVVIGRNEGERLVRCLESVLAADYPRQRVELLYCDSGSTDDSVARAEALGARVFTVQAERPTAALGRNTGLTHASHDLIQFLDGDTELAPDWLRVAVEKFADPAITCVFGRLVERHPERSIYNFWAHHDWYSEPGPAESCGGLAMFRRAALQQVGGYDAATVAGEERDLCYRLQRETGARFLCCAEEMASHDIDITRFGQYWQRCRRVGHAYAEISNRYPDLKSWRDKCRKNLIHGLLPIAALAGSLLLWSPWPVVVWLVLVVLLITRQARRHRARLGRFGSAWLYALHHYVSKWPTLLGQLEFHVRRWSGTARQAGTYRTSGSQSG